MECYTVYRGIALTEARNVVLHQRYTRSERVQFSLKHGANAVFGEGAYFVESVELAAEYAFCHAVYQEDDAAVLVQTLLLERPLYIDDTYPEPQLRADAEAWAHRRETSPHAAMAESGWKVSPETVKSYVLAQNYDGLVIRLPDSSLYFVAYHPDRQVSHIQVDFIFRVTDAKTRSSFQELREAYKQRA